MSGFAADNPSGLTSLGHLPLHRGGLGAAVFRGISSERGGFLYNSTLCYLENDRGEYLMLHRVKKKKDVNQDKWIGVGGKFEGDESPDECLLREVREETGVTLTSWKFRGVVTFLTDGGWEGEYMYLFTADGWEGEFLTDCVEGDLEWVAKEKVPNLPIWEGDKIFLKLLAEDHPPFLLTLEYAGDRLIRAELDGKKLI